MRQALWVLYRRLQHQLIDVCGVHTCEPAHALRAAARAFQPARPQRLLTIGPGGAPEIEMLLDVTEHLSVVALRESERATAVAAGAHFAWLGDIHDMVGVRSDQYDALFASNVLEHVFAPYVALMECRRVLKLGGVAYFVMPTFASPSGSGGTGPYHLHCLTDEVWRELLHKTGLRVNRTWSDTVNGEPYLDYECIAAAPPPPHDQVLASVLQFHDVASPC